MFTKIRHFINIALVLIGFVWATSSFAQNLVFSDVFNTCEWNNEWTSIAQRGLGAWGLTKKKNSPDGTCSLNFIDNLSKQGDTTIVQLYSKWLKAYDFEELLISFDLIFFKNDAQPQTLEFIIDYGKGPEVIKSYDKHVFKGNDVSSFVRQSFKLNVVPGTDLQLSFRYNSHGFKSSFVQLDNIIVNGPKLGDCNFAYIIKELNRCIQSNNIGADFSIDQPSCSENNVASMWYQYTPDFSGILKVSTDADFNDAITFYERNCELDSELACSDRDEYGFKGDELYVNVNEGEYYLIRISGVQHEFSLSEGDYCVQLEKVDSFPATPTNDWCKNAIPLFVDSLCISGTNVNANMDGPFPSLNLRSRADIWYYFDYRGDGADEVIISSNADFSDVITVYTGDCSQLEEVVTNVEGGVLLLSDLQNNQRYYIQVSSYFASLEGRVCMDLYGFTSESPENDSCFQKLSIVVDGDCVEASNRGAGMDSVHASCMLYANSDIWFEFVTPKSGNVVIYPEAQFLYNMAIYSGKCDSLVEAFCVASENLCKGFVNAFGLKPNQKYFIQMSSAYQSSGAVTGDICLQIYSRESAPTFAPLSVTVKENCIAGVLSKLDVVTSGGKGNLSILGYDPDRIYEYGEQYVISVQDQNGCMSIVEGVITCPAQINCENTAMEVIISQECQLDSLGVQTGFIQFEYDVNNTSDSLLVLGTDSGTLLANGAAYRIYVIDLADSCYVIKNGVVDCPEYDCASSDLSLSLSFNCMDSLLQAALIVNANNGLGQYTFSGDLNGQLFNQGDTVTTTVIDAKGCKVTTSAIVNCAFDSCVYAQLDAEVAFECLINQYGNETGEAIMHISHSGGIGNVIYTGLTEGDTLKYGDTFNLTVSDDWGCTSFFTGVIDCEPNTAVRNVFADNRLLKLYPNPTSGFVVIETKDIALDFNEIACINSKGQIVKYFNPLELDNKLLRLDVQQLLPGIYFIRLVRNQRIYVKKFIKI